MSPPRLVIPGETANGLDGIGELRRGMEAIRGRRHLIPADDWTNEVISFFYIALELGHEYPATAMAMRRTMDELLGPSNASISHDRAKSLAIAAGDPAARR